MKISIVVPDRIVVIDGDARTISMDGVPVGLHAIQWDGERGDVEYGKPHRRNETIASLEPFQFLIDRWLAVPPPPPPIEPPPPTKEGHLARTLADPTLAALVEVLAVQLKMTTDEFKAAIKDKIK